MPADDPALEKARCHAYLASIAAAGGAKDADETATGLIAEFGTLAAAAAGPAGRQLIAARGQLGVVNALRTFQGAMDHALRTTLAADPVIGDGPTLLRYLRSKLASRVNESVWLIHLNSRNRLLRDEVLSEGTIDEAPVYVREIIHRALELGTTGIVIAHNHPSGEPTPSQGDINLTRRIAAAAHPLGIVLIDHIVIGRFGHASMRQLGLLPT